MAATMNARAVPIVLTGVSYEKLNKKKGVIEKHEAVVGTTESIRAVLSKIVEVEKIARNLLRVKLGIDKAVPL